MPQVNFITNLFNVAKTGLVSVNSLLSKNEIFFKKTILFLYNICLKNLPNN